MLLFLFKYSEPSAAAASSSLYRNCQCAQIREREFNALLFSQVSPFRGIFYSDVSVPCAFSANFVLSFSLLCSTEFCFEFSVPFAVSANYVSSFSSWCSTAFYSERVLLFCMVVLHQFYSWLSSCAL